MSWLPALPGHQQLHSLQWRHNGRDGVSNLQPHDCLLSRLFRHISKKSKLRVTGFCARNSPITGEFAAQMASNAENVSIWWRHHVLTMWNKRLIHARGMITPSSCHEMIWGANINFMDLQNNSAPLLDLSLFICKCSNKPSWALSLTWFNFNPNMDQ